LDITDSLPPFEEITINDREVTLSGQLADGSVFAFDLSSNPPVDFDQDSFDTSATITVSRPFVRIFDFNESGLLDCGDLAQLSSELASGSQDMRFDVNGDDVISTADIDTWVVDVFGTSPGDANLDGFVNATDFDTWSTFKFSVGTSWCSGDLTSDGRTDVTDQCLERPSDRY
jgi:hypothetical protein